MADYGINYVKASHKSKMRIREVDDNGVPLEDDISANSPGWVYYKRLVDDGYENFYTSVTKALKPYGKSYQLELFNQLDSMAQAEREKEIQLLVDKFGREIVSEDIKLYTEGGAKRLIDLFTEIMQLKGILERTVQKINSDETSITDSAFLADAYAKGVQKAAQEWFGDNKFTLEDLDRAIILLEDKIWEYTWEALNNTKIIHNGNESGGYEELIFFLSKPENKETQKIFIDFFKNTYNFNAEDFLYKSRKNQKNFKAEDLRKSIDVEAKWIKGGNIQEGMLFLAQNVVLQGLANAFNIKLTGQLNNQKSDLIATIGASIDLDKAMSYFQPDNYISDSTRVQNVMAMKKVEQYLSTLSDDNFIIFENAKNYQKKSIRDHGFSSGSPISLQYYYELMSQIQDRNQVAQFTTAIMNTLNGAAFEDKKENLQLLICQDVAYFLFDDFNMVGAKNMGAQAIHILALDNYYIPLSVLLEKMANAIKESYVSPEKYASVKIDGIKDIKYPQPPKGGYTKTHWVEQRREALDEIKITMSFLENFLDLIK